MEGLRNNYFSSGGIIKFHAIVQRVTHPVRAIWPSLSFFSFLESLRSRASKTHTHTNRSVSSLLEVLLQNIYSAEIILLLGTLFDNV